MKRFLTSAICGAAVCLAAPLAAQDEAAQEAAQEAAEAAAQAVEQAATDAAEAADQTVTDQSGEEAAEAGADGVEAQEETTEEGPAPEPADTTSYIIAASDRFLTEYSGNGWLMPDLEICLEEGEVVVLAQPSANIERLELRGPLCTQVADTVSVATIVIETFAVAESTSVRAAVVRGAATPSAGPRRAVFRVASGSDPVLERFPRGSTVTRASEICLERGEQITLVSNRGQRVTYRGPGCAKRNTQPSPGNLGGFTFGWNEYRALLERAVRL